MKQKKIKLSKSTARKWSYEDDYFEKSQTNLIEVTSMFIARLAATLQVIDDKGEEAIVEIVVRKR